MIECDYFRRWNVCVWIWWHCWLFVQFWIIVMPIDALTLCSSHTIKVGRSILSWNKSNYIQNNNEIDKILCFCFSLSSFNFIIYKLGVWNVKRLQQQQQTNNLKSFCDPNQWPRSSRPTFYCYVNGERRIPFVWLFFIWLHAFTQIEQLLSLP